MARYDFLDEETRKKLEERQDRIITKKKQDEVKQSRSKKERSEDKDKSGGPKVYTTEKGEIGGVIYPEGKSEVSKKPSEQIMGKEEKENEEKKDDPEDDLPIKLHHTDKTKVSSEDRPNPAGKEEITPGVNVEKEKSTGDSEDDDDAREEIWQ